MKRFIFLFILVGQSALAQTPTSSPVPDDEAIRWMLITRVDVQKQATGIVLGVVEPKGRRIITYGTMGVGDKRPVDGRTVFDVGSITKVFTALLLTDMAQRGEVALDDPAAKYLPKDVTLPTGDGRQITLADLATHTSGLPLRPANLTSKNPENPYAGYTVDLLYRFLSSFNSRLDIGQYQYSNVGYGLLGNILSRRAQRSYRDLVRTRITEPLGMNDTRIDLTADMKPRVVTGYNKDLVPVPRWESDALESAGAYRSTANDLLRFLEAVLGYRKSALSPAMKAMTETRRPGGMQPATQIALAWNVGADKGKEVIWKNGSVGGFRSFVGYNLKTRIGVAGLANAQTAMGADDIGLHLLDPSVHVDLHTPRLHKEIQLADATLERYVGRYQFSPTDIVTVTREGNHLFGQQPGQDKFEMFAESEREFFLKVVDAQITFELGADGRSTAAIWHQGGRDQRGERMR